MPSSQLLLQLLTPLLYKKKSNCKHQVHLINKKENYALEI